ncbi:RNA polymerase sigma factor [Rothia sp. P6271]|uniref:RNA polymerase sigma factor n=1 Tax=Rothia sp. P6271 TaxID=3402659 RepID=UPI003ACE6223
MALLTPDRVAGLSDALLCERSANGDSDAFQALLRRHAPSMRAYAIRLTGSAADADDVLQETFIQAWKKMDTVENPERVKSWLMMLVNRKGIDLIRARKLNADIDNSPEPVAAGATPEQSAITGSQMGALSEVLKTLPVQQRQIWVMRELGGASYKEIAQTLMISESSVRGKLARARIALLDGLEGWK